MEKIGIIFDLDGTLWDSSMQVMISWNMVLEKEKTGIKLTLDDMHRAMGKTIEEIAELFLPDMREDLRNGLLYKCCALEQEYLNDHPGILYDGTENVIGELKEQRYNLFIVSNSQDGYVQGFLDGTNFQKYFDDYEMAGRTGYCKGQNIKLVAERNGLDKALYVGDTEGDYEATLIAGVPFVHAAYGFGKVPEAKYRLKNIKELSKILKGIFDR